MSRQFFFFLCCVFCVARWMRCTAACWLKKECGEGYSCCFYFNCMWDVDHVIGNCWCWRVWQVLCSPLHTSCDSIHTRRFICSNIHSLLIAHTEREYGRFYLIFIIMVQASEARLFICMWTLYCVYSKYIIAGRLFNKNDQTMTSRMLHCIVHTMQFPQPMLLKFGF